VAAVTQVRILVTAVTFFLSLLSNLSDTNLGAGATFHVSVSGIMVSIAAFQAVDPGSIPG
jgi:hypothetical protein